MAFDVSSEGARLRRVDLQERLREAAHSVIARKGKDASGEQLFRDIRNYLIKASDRKLIRESHAEIRKILLHSRNQQNQVDIAVGNVRNFNRDPSLPHFTRRDGGWFDFQLLAKEEQGQTDIIAYDFELRLPADSAFKFVRFDLNPPDGRDKEKDGLRSHVHLNSDDDGLSAPAPVMSPFEVLDLFLHGLQITGRIRRGPVEEA